MHNYVSLAVHSYQTCPAGNVNSQHLNTVDQRLTSRPAICRPLHQQHLLTSPMHHPGRHVHCYLACIGLILHPRTQEIISTCKDLCLVAYQLT